MSEAVESCRICSASKLKPAGLYTRCRVCGHEHARAVSPHAIINDNLSLQSIKGLDALTRFKLALCRKFQGSGLGLIDIGSASGKFLYHAKPDFNPAVGIEVSSECRHFSSEILGVSTHSDLTAVSNLKTTRWLVTLWHSLEHLSFDVADRYFTLLEGPAEKIVISVPNARSWVYQLMGAHYAYYDSSSHVHQFSVKSLDLWMDKYGFKRKAIISGAAYSIFGYLQTFMNLLTPAPQNYFYYRKKRKWDFGFSKRTLKLLDFYSYALALVGAPLAIALYFTDLFWPKHGTVINAVYERRS